MSSMTKHLYSTSLRVIAALTIPAALASPASAQDIVFKSGTGDMAASSAIPRAQLDPSGGNVPLAMQRWRNLSQRGGNYSFGDYASFLMTYPGWPSEKTMRRKAEQSINVLSWSPNQVIAYFDRMPPLTNGGRAKYALALESVGKTQQAQEWGRRAWREGPLTIDVEQRLLSFMRAVLTSADHDARVDALLWKGAISAAERNLAYTSPSQRQVFAARIAAQRGSPNGAQVSAAGNAAFSDSGLLTDRATVMRKSGQSYAVRQMLANRPPLASLPHDAEEWYETLLTNARGAANDRQWSTAFAIASKIDDALPPGTDVSKKELGVRDDYTSLAWLAGTVALNRMNRPSDAIGMFERYGNAARSPQTKSKGWYWAGHAARKIGDTATANAFFERAAKYYEHFYGQLSLEALGRPLPSPVPKPPLPQVNEGSNSAYLAARLAPQLGSRKEQTLFLRAIANSAETQQEFTNAFALSKTLRRPDLQVMAGRNARIEGHSNFVGHAYPTLNPPAGHQHNWTMIQAITRQESQFDRAAISHAGARGLMQLMPATAREVSRQIGVPYSRAALTTDTTYNVKLGSTYIQRMLRYYNGSYPLAVAAYNAGPGNVNKWLRRNGDPRTGAIDILTWIERIPIFETKNYVQRVLENAVFYEHLHPEKARMRGPNQLSRYLAKRTPG